MKTLIFVCSIFVCLAACGDADTKPDSNNNTGNNNTTGNNTAGNNTAGNNTAGNNGDDDRPDRPGNNTSENNSQTANNGGNNENNSDGTCVRLPASIDFGEVTVGGSYLMTFTIENCADSHVEVDLFNSTDEIRVDSQVAVAANGSAEVDIWYEPFEAGRLNALLDTYPGTGIVLQGVAR